ncbi:hypothetical protein BU25DRAFT_416952 [Macroventuria anomochaeta]|uniref:Uncharacterized protein n=1 Tax=Macroventuria anomochaeta TaxID=301207 RepID=A0ACB6SHH9_9PLEO|nr:uncharacterized protein BU25DRAFT_416952 [Macroventuria anomochaeta]KAF2633801.1 hypothetical protein BU25DRAFT_416952 [Macroventuria anomochaeta]
MSSFSVALLVAEILYLKSCEHYAADHPMPLHRLLAQRKRLAGVGDGRRAQRECDHSCQKRTRVEGCFEVDALEKDSNVKRFLKNGGIGRADSTRGDRSLWLVNWIFGNGRKTSLVPDAEDQEVEPNPEEYGWQARNDIRSLVGLGLRRAEGKASE